jgi:heme/copper-type cytochrome/quinol oxidase subunit 2
MKFGETTVLICLILFFVWFWSLIGCVIVFGIIGIFAWILENYKPSEKPKKEKESYHYNKEKDKWEA